MIITHHKRISRLTKGFAMDFLLKVHTPRALIVWLDLTHKPPRTHPMQSLVRGQLELMPASRGSSSPDSGNLQQVSKSPTLYPIKNSLGLKQQGVTVQKNTDTQWVCDLSWGQWGATEGFSEICGIVLSYPVSFAQYLWGISLGNTFARMVFPAFSTPLQMYYGDDLWIFFRDQG